MKVDLHLHSIFSKSNGDSIKFESFIKTFKTLKSHRVKVASFSDHNIFNSKAYIKNKKLAAMFGILLFPAVELDVIRKNEKTGNIIMIFRESLSSQELKKLENIINKKTGKRRIKVDDINILFDDFDSIIVPHVGKSDFCSYDDLLNIKYDAIELTKFNHSNYKKFAKRLKEDKKQTSLVAWSDTHIWTSYPQVYKLYTWIENVKSFDDLKKQLKKNKDYIKGGLNV